MMYYALSRPDDDAPYHVFGKGDGPAEAEGDARRTIHEDRDDYAALARHLVVVTREEAEEKGYVAAGAPVIWYDHLGRYRVEDMGPYKPLGIEKRLRDVLR